MGISYQNPLASRHTGEVSQPWDQVQVQQSGPNNKPSHELTTWKPFYMPNTAILCYTGLPGSLPNKLLLGMVYHWVYIIINLLTSLDISKLGLLIAP